jgi:hypothetical protein
VQTGDQSNGRLRVAQPVSTFKNGSNVDLVTVALDFVF